MSEEYKAPTNWRALCEELADALACHHPGHADDDELVNRVRAALAESVGEGPTDEELLELTEDWPATTGPRHDLSGCPEVPLYSVFADEVVEFARAVLDRFGHQPAPVPVAERPWEREGWCDEQGRCWFGWSIPERRLNPAMWTFCKPEIRDIRFHQASLPATALPLPV